MAGKSVLGKNLGGLLSESLATTVDEHSQALQSLPLNMIQRGQFQPRQDMDPNSLSELADSIRSQGVVQPIVVRPLKNGQYEIIAGERRFRASKLAGLTEIPAVIREMSDEKAVVCALVENVQRSDLNVIEEAKAVARLAEEFSLTHQEISNLVGKSRSAITNSLRLLNLDEHVQQLVKDGQLDAGHARVLVVVPPEQQLLLAKQIIERQLNVRQAEQLVKDLAKPEEQRPVRRPPLALEQLKALENNFANQFGCKVAIKHRDNGKGKLVIHYNSLAELRALLEEAEAEV